MSGKKIAIRGFLCNQCKKDEKKKRKTNDRPRYYQRTYDTKLV